MSALRAFVSDLLEADGAVVDPIEPDVLDVLAPEPLRKAFGWPDDIVRLGFGATRPHGAVPIGLEGDWLDRVRHLLGDRGRLRMRPLPRSDAAKPSSPARLIQPALQMPDTVLTVIRPEPT